MIKKIRSTLQRNGILGLLRIIYFRARRISPNRAKSFLEIKHLLMGKRGMEIGGPSQVFMKSGEIPIYPIASRIDNSNYCTNTIWESSLKEGQNFQFNPGKPPGWQFIAEATKLEGIPSGSYDFVLSSHVLEHTANPILALKKWINLLRYHGSLILILPHKDGTFDHRRTVTTMEHLISDFERQTGEDDLTHMPEILALHDLSRDLAAGTMEDFKARSERNAENRCFHHHVFDTRLAVNLIDYMGLQIRFVETIQPLHILIVAQKLSVADVVNNACFTSETAEHLKKSPFPSDSLFQSL